MSDDTPKRIEQAWQQYLLAWATSVYGATGSPRDIDRHARDRSRAAFVAGWHARGRQSEMVAGLRTLAARLEDRNAAPSLDGYGLADGLRAAADLLEGKPGPLVHPDLRDGSDAFPERVTLAAYAEHDRSDS